MRAAPLARRTSGREEGIVAASVSSNAHSSPGEIRRWPTKTPCGAILSSACCTSGSIGSRVGARCGGRRTPDPVGSCRAREVTIPARPLPQSAPDVTPRLACLHLRLALKPRARYSAAMLGTCSVEANGGKLAAVSIAPAAPCVASRRTSFAGLPRQPV